MKAPDRRHRGEPAPVGRQPAGRPGRAHHHRKGRLAGPQPGGGGDTRRPRRGAGRRTRSSRRPAAGRGCRTGPAPTANGCSPHRQAYPAAHPARAPGGHRLRRHGRGVRPHVRLPRVAGDARREPPARPAQQGPGGGPGLGGRLPPPGCPPAQGGPGRGHRPGGGRGGRPLRRRSGGPRHPRPAGGGLDPQLRGPRVRVGGRRDRPGLRDGQPALPVERPPHLRRRRPVGEAAAVVGGHHAGAQDRRARDGGPLPQPPPPRLRQGGPGRVHRPRDRRGRHRRGGGVRLRPQDPGRPRCRSRPTPRP